MPDDHVIDELQTLLAVVAAGHRVLLRVRARREDMLATGTNAGRALPPGGPIDAGLARGFELSVRDAVVAGNDAEIVDCASTRGRRKAGVGRKSTAFGAGLIDRVHA
jgi:hypothetical protein